MSLPPSPTSVNGVSIDLATIPTPILEYLHANLIPYLQKYDESEPRDDAGKWTAGGGSPASAKPYYHVAPARVRASIRQHGIDPSRFGTAYGGDYADYKPEAPGGFYLFDNLTQARWYAQYQKNYDGYEPMDIWEVRVPGPEAHRLVADEGLFPGDEDPEANAGSWYHEGLAKPTRMVETVKIERIEALKYDPSEPRDAAGKWTSDGSGIGVGEMAVPQVRLSSIHPDHRADVTRAVADFHARFPDLPVTVGVTSRPPAVLTNAGWDRAWLAVTTYHTVQLNPFWFSNKAKGSWADYLATDRAGHFSVDPTPYGTVLHELGHVIDYRDLSPGPDGFPAGTGPSEGAVKLTTPVSGYAAMNRGQEAFAETFVAWFEGKETSNPSVQSMAQYMAQAYPGAITKSFDPSEPRDEAGRWTAAGAGTAMPTPHAAALDWSGRHGAAGYAGTVRAALRDAVKPRGTVEVLKPGMFGPESASVAVASRTWNNARTLAIAIDKAEPESMSLYRGISMNDAQWQAVQQLKPGSELDLNIASWTHGKDIAEQFANGEYGTQPASEHPVVFQLDPGARAYDATHDIAQGPGFTEHLTDGRFTVESVEALPGEGEATTVRLKQTATFTDPGQFVGTKAAQPGHLPWSAARFLDWLEPAMDQRMVPAAATKRDVRMVPPTSGQDRGRNETALKFDPSEPRDGWIKYTTSPSVGHYSTKVLLVARAILKYDEDQARAVAVVHQGEAYQTGGRLSPPQAHAATRPFKKRSAGGKARDLALQPILDRLRSDLVALVNEHGNVDIPVGGFAAKYDPSGPRDEAGQWTAGADAASGGGNEAGLAEKYPLFDGQAGQHFEELRAQFPQVHVAVEAAAGMAPRTVAAYDPTRKVIGINPAQWASRVDYLPYSNFAHESYYVDPSPAGVLTHEFGHAVQDWLDNGAAKDNPAYQKYEKWWVSGPGEARAGGLSGYASIGDASERWAEAFAAAYGPNPQAGGVAAAVRSIFSGTLQKFDDSEPRDEAGRWTAAAGAHDHSDVAQIESQNEISRALSYYKGAGYSSMNDDLRSNRGDLSRIDDPDTLRYLPLLDQAFTEAKPTTEKQTVWRGVKDNMTEELSGLSKGDTFVDPGFVSTSHDEKVARGYDNILKIDVPQGAKAIEMPGSTAEAEVLLPRNSEFEFLGMTTSKPPIMQTPYGVERPDIGYWARPAYHFRWIGTSDPDA